MARWKSVYDEKTKTIRQEPADDAARLEVLDRGLHEGKVTPEEYAKRKSELDKKITETKIADAKAQKSAQEKQAVEREAGLKARMDKKKSVADAAKKRSQEKAKRKEGK